MSPPVLWKNLSFYILSFLARTFPFVDAKKRKGSLFFCIFQGKVLYFFIFFEERFFVFLYFSRKGSLLFYIFQGKVLCFFIFFEERFFVFLYFSRKGSFVFLIFSRKGSLQNRGKQKNVSFFAWKGSFGFYKKQRKGSLFFQKNPGKVPRPDDLNQGKVPNFLKVFEERFFGQRT